MQGLYRAMGALISSRTTSKLLNLHVVRTSLDPAKLVLLLLPLLYIIILPLIDTMILLLLLLSSAMVLTTITTIIRPKVAFPRGLLARMTRASGASHCHLSYSLNSLGGNI